MRIRWRGLELPSRVLCDDKTLTAHFGRFMAEPFERGFGTTVGNSLRRVLLSSLEGAAVTAVKIAGVNHEFTTVPGVLEDVTEILLNVKQIRLRMHTDETRTLTIKTDKKGQIKASDLVGDSSIEIVNPDLHLVTLSEPVPFEMTLEVRKGRGYLTAEDAEPEQKEIGRIPVDAIFSPVLRVRYKTEDCRVGQVTNFDRLIMEVWTDGTLSPEMAMVEAAKILRKHLNPFVQYFEIGRELQQEEGRRVRLREQQKEESELKAKLSLPVTELDLSVRASNCLEAENIRTIGELVSKSEPELLLIRNFGRVSLDEIQRKLENLGLRIGHLADEPVDAGEAPEAQHAS